MGSRISFTNITYLGSYFQSHLMNDKDCFFRNKPNYLVNKRASGSSLNAIAGYGETLVLSNNSDEIDPVQYNEV